MHFLAALFRLAYLHLMFRHHLLICQLSLSSYLVVCCHMHTKLLWRQKTSCKKASLNGDYKKAALFLLEKMLKISQA